MKITERQFGDVIVMDLRGAIAGRRAADMIATAVRRHTREGVRRIVANLAGVSAVDLVGLGALVDAYMEARQASAALALACVTKRIHDLVVITRLLTIFDTYDSVEEALGGATTMETGAKPAPISLMSLGMIQRFLRRV